MLKSIMSKMKICKGEEKSNDSQVVCGCFNIKEQDIAKAISNGAKSFEEVQEITKVGTGCNNCSASVKALVDDLLLEQKINENQVVCGCFGLTVKDLKRAINNGAKSFEEVQAVTKVGTECGECVEGNKQLVAKLLAI